MTGLTQESKRIREPLLRSGPRGRGPATFPGSGSAMLFAVKNKTTKGTLVVIVDTDLDINLSIQSGYFFFEVFLAFLAGAFFLAGMG